LSAAAGDDARGAALNLNLNGAASGRVGVALALPPGQTLGAGRRQVVALRFAAVSGRIGKPGPISFTDQPVARELLDVEANPLPAAFNAGIIRGPGR
jgi:hypothetical protein